ncbi:uncharacterized protein LOC126914763 [Bombus affinis]|uniref:uncharacterized protein LOC126914762 n=1 Tax=Bombus affinis TaxID=309941 RepID=UPI0021B79D27|nr:uncharacterized protein LOC126914762 [Bombus affinis]XP_050575125.1 uncharacterized protein LOC126914763 [Bombus affinis]
MQIKILFELVKHDWNDIQHNENELDMLRSRTSTGKLITIVATTIIVMTSILFAISQLLPVIIDIMIPAKESRSIHSANMTFIIVQYKNSSYFALFSLIIVNILGAIVMTTTETTYVILCQHLVGMFTVAGNKIEHALDCDKYELSPTRKNFVIFLRIVNAVNTHKRCLTLVSIIFNR